jgi:Fe-S-cluster containining protein
VNAFLSALPPELNTRDDALERELAVANSSAKAKLGKLYLFLSEVGRVAEPFVACRKGCSACCRMDVSITTFEAERLALVSGRRLKRPRAPTPGETRRHLGTPCPFLVNDSCSVYEARPFACRAHFSFDTSAYWCQPERAFDEDMPMMEMGGAKKAYTKIAVSSPLGGLADIRDFFDAA